MTSKKLQSLKAKGKIRGFTAIKKKPAKKMSVNSQALIWISWNLKDWCEERNLELKREYRFHPVRMFRFDFAVDEQNIKLAVEFEGGIFLRTSGHNTAKHYTKDCQKYSLASLEGWTVLRYTALNYKDMLSDLEKIDKK